MNLNNPVRIETASSIESCLSHYQTLEDASRAMLTAARMGNWDTVCRLEDACRVVIARLRRMREAQPLSDDEQTERMRVLRAIIANDAEIRRIAEPDVIRVAGRPCSVPRSA
ncbi:flagellar protein FliT [Ramlibacter sp. AN1015]|uniref:flagellar protein FliT n=1 Tax=Ramlibacter sp. AN1015 TaxID=3133428 RepID=UPI0030BF0EF8